MENMVPMQMLERMAGVDALGLAAVDAHGSTAAAVSVDALGLAAVDALGSAAAAASVAS